ncbi:MAG: Flp pilus assembly complex ATPase component TadA [Acidobacteriota bacterium]|nr:MAG: Flp pilus assembly complex ATPase component TadA [Acidobacteriota bacterium]
MSEAKRSSVEVKLGILVDSDLLGEFPEDVAIEYNVIPLRRLGRGMLVGSITPPDEEKIKELSDKLGIPICAIPCQISDIPEVFGSLYEHPASKQKIGEILQGQNSISEDELQTALDEQESSKPRRLGEILVELGLISQDELMAGLSGQERKNNPSVMPSLLIESKLTELLPESYARQYGVLPLTIADDEFALASASVLDEATVAELKTITGRPIRLIPVHAEELTEAIDRTYLQRRRSRLKELRLGELLSSEGLITKEQLNVCLDEQKKSGQKLGELLVKKGFVSEDTIYSTLSLQMGVDYLRFATSEIDLELSHLISRRFAEQNQVLMLSVNKAKHELTLAMADPLDLNLRDILQGIVAQHGYRMRPVLASPSNIQSGIAYTYQSRGLLDSQVEVETVFPDTSGEELTTSGEMPEMRRLVNQLLYSAVTEGVSDIHLENLETEVQIRFRVDGVLEDRLTPISKRNIASVISLFKVDSGLDIAERRRSQDGVFKKRLGKDRFIDFRINVHATPFGEDAVIRILDRQKNLLPLEKLGFDEPTFANYTRLVSNPQGLILFTGPTGSGKTTTLYSTLSFLNQGDRKIVTAEDPIEYVLKGISQYQVNEAIGNTFDDYARRFLRKDPDIILIGEIRDTKTAKACVSAAMTGHLVFSTLHTNDSIGVVQRLSALETPHSSIADSLLLVVSQRLARRICTQCREPYTPGQKLLNDFFPNGVPSDLTFYRGIGCEACRLKGYRGRVGLYEFWELKNKTRKMISQGVSEDDIREQALTDGLQVLLSDALVKVRHKLTTLEELSRVISIDQLRRYAGLPNL